MKLEKIRNIEDKVVDEDTKRISTQNNQAVSYKR